MTNGEKILNAFPNAITRVCKNKGFTYIEVEQNDKWIADFDMEWWNAEYKEPTIKNNSVVDIVSRKAVHDMLENLPITVEDKWFNWLQKACIRLAELPPVTPQEPILDKIKAEIQALSPKPTAYDVVDGNPVKDAIWETLIEVDKIIDKYKAESEDIK